MCTTQGGCKGASRPFDLLLLTYTRYMKHIDFIVPRPMHVCRITVSPLTVQSSAVYMTALTLEAESLNQNMIVSRYT